MRLSARTRLGPYEILALIGSGGMGEVYKARDTRLDRSVAIKFSNEQFSHRFESEARAVAALSHPNICALFDVGPNYLVMELIEGETLAQRIQEGALPVQEALAVARQLTEAPDGRRFLINTKVGDPPLNPITVVLNWTAALGK